MLYLLRSGSKKDPNIPWHAIFCDDIRIFIQNIMRLVILNAVTFFAHVTGFCTYVSDVLVGIYLKISIIDVFYYIYF